MQVSQVTRRPAVEGARLSVAERIHQRSRKLLAQRGVDDYCEVAVEQRGEWIVFWGLVDSQATRIRLFSLVPEVDGARRIVDYLQIVAPAAAVGN